MGKENCLLLVHMSDIHCGPRFERDILLQAIDEINDLGPDAIVITGDLTENGLFSEFQEAKRYIQLLKCEHLLVGSGNHDSRTTGYRLFPSFFGEPSSAREFKNVVLIGLNSSRPDQDSGEVGYRQRLWMKECLDKYADRTKIVALHHHLLPVPDTGMEKNIISDAGDVLWSLISHGADLVLCGHRHRPWVWNMGNMNIFYAGTVSTNRLRGFYKNSYNIIEIKNSGIQASLKIVGGKEFALNPKTIKTLKIPEQPMTECIL